MKKISPFSKEAEKIFEQCIRNGKAFTSNSQLTRLLPRNHPEIFDKKNGFMGIYRNESRRESIITPFDNVVIVPLPEPESRFNERRRKKFGIYRI